MDFGISFLSNNLMLPILDFFYGIVPSYGLAIVALTLVIRFALYPLNAGSLRNMRRMKVAQPLMKERVDPTNSDKRLVGYALLQEFVDDEDYNSKATLMLEESLGQELRSKRAEGLDEAHRSAVVAIVSALAQSSDCRALERAAHSIDKITLHHAREQDAKEVLEIFRIYVRRLVGRASLTCKTMKDFVDVRRPLIDAIQRMPPLGGAMIVLPDPIANERVARLLIEVCDEESSISGMTECRAIFQHYGVLCADPTSSPNEAVACEAIKTAAAALARQTAAPIAAP